MSDEEKKNELLRLLAYCYEDKLEYAEDIHSAGIVNSLIEGIEIYEAYRRNG